MPPRNSCALNAIATIPVFAALRPAAHCHRRAFALIVTLLILSLLVIVAVSYLSSMVNERQTADAFSSKTRAEQVAQSGVDSAIAMLTESFRDFPDSATAWDIAQSTNNDNTANEGTSLYLRAVPDVSNPVLSATPAPNATPGPANLSSDSNPNNPACKNFVLPLVSGVLGGRAHVVSDKANILRTMNVTQSDPTQQNFSDLNVRRYAGDTQGVIGSPPASPAAPSSTPKPARALWVNLKGNDGRTTGRYAFWVDDESFRANNNFLSAASTPPDNPARPLVTPAPNPTPQPRNPLPGDLTLVGPLTRIGDSNAANDASTILSTRSLYPGNFFPDPMGFAHGFPTPAASPSPGASGTSLVDTIRYLTTSQSGALNLTRHGTQRLNLNDVVVAPAPGSDPTVPATQQTLQNEVNQIVQTLKFHLPYFGERFYRLTTDAAATTLNDATQVPGSPKSSPTTVGNDHSEIYYYKVAANLIDYLDTDSQPTIIDSNGNVVAQTSVIGAINGGGSANDIWAQGKEAAPYLQEAAVRIRANITPHAANGTASTVPHSFDLRIDYYLEFWNMSDRDIYASPPSAGSTAANLHGATVLVTNQPTWEMTSPYGNFLCDGSNPLLLTYPPYMDCQVDLTNGVQLNGAGPALAGGVLFKAGTVTVVTTDPDCATYVFTPPSGQTGPSTSATSHYATNPNTTYYCPNLLKGTRHYTGTNTITSGHKGIEQKFRAPGYTYDYETEVTLANGSGYLDSVPFALAERYYGTTWYSDTAPGYVDYSYSSALMGNSADSHLSDHAVAITPRISQLGDPRTNNESLSISSGYVPTPNLADQSHYFYSLGADTTLGYVNPSQKPDAASTGSFPWPDYYTLPTGQYPTSTDTTPPMNAVNAPMVVADGPITSIGQLGDVFDPARLPGVKGGIALSRGGGRTFKIGQRDDRYCGDPTGNVNNNSADAVPASNGWAAWRLADVFSVDDSIELPARLNINGVLRDNGAALLAALYGFNFQPITNSADPVIHGDNHLGAASPAGKSLDSASTSNGYSQLVSQMITRLKNPSPKSSTGSSASYEPSGPFFERGELGEIGDSNNSVFGMSDPLGNSQSGSSTALVAGVDMYKAYDHSREELFRRISELICTRGDTFTIYAVGQAITQPTLNGPTKIAGTHRMRVTFRLVPMNSDGSLFHPATNAQNQPVAFDIASRFVKPNHYDAQILSVNTF